MSLIKKYKLTKEDIEKDKEWIERGYKEGDEIELPQSVITDKKSVKDFKNFNEKASVAWKEIFDVLNKYGLIISPQIIIEGGKIISNIRLIPKPSGIIVPPNTPISN